jgi:hypothetical protein
MKFLKYAVIFMTTQNFYLSNIATQRCNIEQNLTTCDRLQKPIMMRNMSSSLLDTFLGFTTVGCQVKQKSKRGQ